MNKEDNKKYKDAIGYLITITDTKFKIIVSLKELKDFAIKEDFVITNKEFNFNNEHLLNLMDSFLNCFGFLGYGDVYKFNIIY